MLVNVVCSAECVISIEHESFCAHVSIHRYSCATPSYLHKYARNCLKYRSVLFFALPRTAFSLPLSKYMVMHICFQINGFVSEFIDYISAASDVCLQSYCVMCIPTSKSKRGEALKQ